MRAQYRSHRFDRHFHDEFAIGIIEAGCQAFTYDKTRRLDMPQGSVSLISPGIVHEGWPGDPRGWSYRMFYPSREMISDAAEEIFGRASVSFNKPVVEDPGLFSLILALHRAAANPACHRLELESLYLRVVRTALVSHGGLADPAAPAADNPELVRARDFLEEHYEAPVTLSQLGNVAELSKFHLLRQFKASFGLPPHAYLVQIRLQRARSFILNGTGLAEAAALVGFSDQAHMTRVFKKSLGYTPGAVAASRY